MSRTNKYKGIIWLSSLCLFIGVLTYVLNGSIVEFIGWIIYQPIILVVLHKINKKRHRQLDDMWELAECLNLTEVELSSMSSLGTYDLVATKAKIRTFLPPKKEVDDLVKKLNVLANEKAR